MHDDPRNPPPNAPHDLQAEIARAARDEDASLKAGLAKLALDSSPGSLRTSTRLRNYFLTGLVVVGPVGITLYIAWNFIALVDGWVKPYVPAIYNPDSYLPFPLPGVGLVFAVLLLTIIGALAANLLGRSLISAGEMMLGRTPIVRNVYQGLKQIFESVVTASSPQQSFQKVAMMEFPSKGIWSIVFVTGEAAREITKEVPGQDLVSVFMPTGMLPPSGFVCFVPRKNVVPIHMSVEDAAKIIISAGMVNPETQARLRDIAAKARSGATQTPVALQAPPPAA
ncbi:MAG TPA: DUF502 domain-containing protein [Hyphomicrobiaceae bacterium]|jgi:uncharacterized membrane protein